MSLGLLCAIVAVWLAFDIGFSVGVWWAGNRKADALQDVSDRFMRDWVARRRDEHE